MTSLNTLNQNTILESIQQTLLQLTEYDNKSDLDDYLRMFYERT